MLAEKDSAVADSDGLCDCLKLAHKAGTMQCTFPRTPHRLRVGSGVRDLPLLGRVVVSGKLMCCIFLRIPARVLLIRDGRRESFGLQGHLQETPYRILRDTRYWYMHPLRPHESKLYFVDFLFVTVEHPSVSSMIQPNFLYSAVALPYRRQCQVV